MTQYDSRRDFMLHSQVRTKMGVLRRTLRTGYRSGYRFGGENNNSRMWRVMHPK